MSDYLEEERQRKEKFRVLATKYEEALQKSQTEEDMHAFLKANPNLILWSLNDGARPYELVSKFPLGNDYVTDFVIFGTRSFSYPFHCILIELESPNARQFTKSGVYSKTLNQALKQVNDWVSWVHQHNDEFCLSLATKLTVPIPKDLSIKLRTAYLSYKIVIGRRQFLTKKDKETISAFYNQHHGSLEIATYDRILDKIRVEGGIMPKEYSDLEI